MKAIQRTPILAFPDIDVSDAAALKALNSGRAEPEQQKRALDWIIKKACMIGGQPFCPGEPDSTAFNNGRQKVGVDILFVLSTPLDKFDTKKQPQRRPK